MRPKEIGATLKNKRCTLPKEQSPQQVIGDKIGLTKSQIIGIEKGTLNCTINTLLKYVDFLNLKLIIE